MDNNVENNNPEKIKEEKKEFLSGLRKVCIIISLGVMGVVLVRFLILGFFIAWIGIGFGATSDGTSLFEILGMCFGEMIKFFVTPGTGMLLWLVPLLMIWLFYIFSIVFLKLYFVLGKKSKKVIGIFSKIIISILIAIIIIVIVISIIDSVLNYGNCNIGKAFTSPPLNPYDYDTTSYCFMYHDKFYYVGTEGLKNKLYSLSLYGFVKQKVSSKDVFNGAVFHMVYNNEAYFYSLKDSSNKKIDLTTRKITNLDNKYNYIEKTMNDGIIFAFENGHEDGKDYSMYRKIDLKNNKVLTEHKAPNDITEYGDYMFEYDNGDIYFLIKPYEEEHPVIYKNENIIYQFEEYSNSSLPELEFILSNKEYIYYTQNDYIYKLNTDKGQIEKKIPLEYKDIKRISSGNNQDNYFYANERIYSYNFDRDEFDLIVTNVPKQPEKIYHVNNTLIFTENDDNVGYVRDDNLGSVLIFDTISKYTNNIKKVRKVSFDEEKMYVIIQKSIGNCKVKTYQLNDFK